MVVTTKIKIIIGLICIVLIAVFFGARAYQYSKQPDYKTFKSNITFQYPKSWKVQAKCGGSEPFIQTGTLVKGDFAGKKMWTLC